MYLKVYITSLIVICLTPKTCSQNKGLGISACTYYGKPDPTYKCTNPFVPVENLPAGCTSYIYEVLYMDTENNYIDLFHKEEYLDMLLQSNKDVYLYFAHSQDNWNTVLSCNSINGSANASTEMESIKPYLDKHKGIKGLILLDLIPETGVTNNLPDYTDRIVAYIGVIKEHYPDLAVGMAFNGISVTLYYSSDTKAEDIDFKIIDPHVDFYVLDFIGIETGTCTDELRDGSIPLTGSQKFTVESIFGAIEQAGIPKSKVHYFYQASGTSEDVSMCERTYAEICTKQSGSEKWCADTQQTFRDKGKFAKDNGGGFVLRNIDLDDPNSCCQCGFPYPAFHFMLDGYNGITTPTPCPLFDRA